jgi:hypothetical protein
MNWQAITVFSTATIAFVGFFAKYINDVRIENRRLRAKFISDQLQNLYGPLFSLSHASEEAWNSFRSRCRPGGPFFGRSPPPTESELQQWRLWMTEVFMPVNLQMEAAIIQNAHLVEGNKMPISFLKFLAHIEVYKIVLKQWAQDNYIDHTSYLDYPEEFHSDIREIFSMLKLRQIKLM